MKKYEAAYAGYIHEEPKVSWSSEDEVKAKLTAIDFDKENTAGGLPIISDGKKCYADTGDSHTVVAAISGMKKSICAFMPLIFTLGKCGENMVITDPKGELFEKTAGYLKSEGYNVKALDFRNMDKDCYNVLDEPRRVYRDEDKDRGMMMLNDLVNILAEKLRSSGKCDPFWPDTASSYLSGTGIMMLDSYPEDAVNMSNWCEFNTENGVKMLKMFTKALNTKNSAMLNMETVLSEAEKTLMSTVSTASSFLTPFLQNDRLAGMLSCSTVTPADLIQPKTALYIITDDTSTTCDTIVGIIITQIQSHLVHRAYENKGKLDTRVNFVLDEFASFPIPNIAAALATHRSRNIRYYLCVQSIDGLRHRYDNYESLLSNCGNLLFLGSTENELLNRVSQQFGTTTVTPDGKEQPLASAAELMDMKKEWFYKEAIYLNLSEGIRYNTMLPSIELYDIGFFKPPEYNRKPTKIRYYNIEELVDDIDAGKAHLPFSEPVKPLPKKRGRRKKYEDIYRGEYYQSEELDELRENLKARFEALFSDDSDSDVDIF